MGTRRTSQPPGAPDKVSRTGAVTIAEYVFASAMCFCGEAVLPLRASAVFAFGSSLPILDRFLPGKPEVDQSFGWNCGSTGGRKPLARRFVWLAMPTTARSSMSWASLKPFALAEAVCE